MPFDTPADAPAAQGGFWLSISDLAKHKGLSKQALAERVVRFEAAGKLTTRPGPGRSKLVNVAEFDRAAGEIGDLAREQGAATRRGAALPAPLTAIAPPVDPDAPVYTVEQARNMAYRAELARLDLEERQEKLVRRDRVKEALRLCVDPIARAFDRLPQEADELADAYERGGLHGLRQALKELARKGRSAAAEALEGMLQSAPTDDEPLPFTEGPTL